MKRPRWFSLLHPFATVISLIGLVAPVSVVGSVGARDPGAKTQWSEEALTAAEWQQARRFIERFSERLAETDDLVPLVDEFFVSDFGGHLRYLVPDATIDHIVVNEQFYVFGVTPELVAEALDEDLEAYFVQTANFWYLIARRLYGSYPMQEMPRDLVLPDLVGREAMDILGADPLLRLTLDSPGWSRPGRPFSAGSGGVLIDDIASFRTTTVALGEAVAQMRSRQAVAGEAVLYAAYVEEMGAILEQASSRGESLAGRATVCGSECGLLPAPTRFIEVFAFPFLHLHLVEQDGELRIFYIDLPLD